MKLVQHISLTVVLLCIAYVSASQAPPNRKSAKQYIEEFKHAAIREMHEDGIPASVTLAQGIQESNSGNSPLAIYANNHFGIKCQKEWTGPTFIQDDDKKDECFRKYESVFDSYVDHSNFLKSRPRYAFLFQLEITDYKGWAHGLKASGYATDPMYANRLIKIIEENKLSQFDTVKQPSPELIASVDNYFSAAEKKIHKGKYSAQNEKYELPYSKRSIQLINGRKFIYTRTGETVDEISTEYDVDPRLIRKYNELDKEKKTRFRPGQIVFLQPKRNKGSEEFHTVQRGETMYNISQKYGIKLRKLYKKNKMKPGSEPKAGEKLWLRKTPKG
ncbi:MAG: glucosaminidase domain-containing protein [Bacteroidetes bacterium]|nr:glucosaminidase domain-containing protein [Bacteroidota bacterium]